MSVFTRLENFIHRDLWVADIETKPRSERVSLLLLRLAVVAVSEFRKTALSVRATGLVYTTLLALVPFLAVTISVLKAFGVHKQLEPFLAQALEPFGPKGLEITNQIIEFVSDLNVGVLGVVGVGGLLVTTLIAISQIEHALNVVWRVRESRPLAQKITNYLSVVLIGPVLVFTAFALTASVQSHWLVQRMLEMEPIGSLFLLAARLMPFFLLCVAFIFVYYFIPYTDVRPASALVGGITAAILWQFAGGLFAGFVAGAHQYTVLYSGLAILIFFMIWLYIAWVIVLAGAQVAYFYQYPTSSSRTDRGTSSDRASSFILNGLFPDRCCWVIRTKAESASRPGGVVKFFLVTDPLISSAPEQMKNGSTESATI